MLESKINQPVEAKLASNRRAEKNLQAQSSWMWQQQLISLQRSVGNRNTVRLFAATTNAPDHAVARLLFKHPLGSISGRMLMRDEADESVLFQLRSYTSTRFSDRSRCMRLIRLLDAQERQLLRADRDLLTRVLSALDIAQLFDVFQILYPSVNLLMDQTEFSSSDSRRNYIAVEPHIDTLRRLVLYLAELPHSHLAGLIMAFAHRYTVRDNGESEVLQAYSRTEFRARPFDHEVIVFGTDSRGRAIDPAVRTLHGGVAFAVGGPGTTPEPQSYFRGSVRHEVGHVVGVRIRVPYRGRALTGIEFARTWSGWRDEQQPAFVRAMWNHQRSVNTGLIHERGGGEEIIYAPSTEARQWFMWVLASGYEPPRRYWNNIESQSDLSLDEKLRILGESEIRSQPLVRYVSAIRNNVGDARGIPGNSNLCAGWQPSGTDGSRVFLKKPGRPGTPGTQRYVSIRMEAFLDLARSHGLYSLNSIQDMFAEMYNGWHGGVVTPRAIQVDGESYNPTEFFRLLQQQ